MSIYDEEQAFAGELQVGSLLYCPVSLARGMQKPVKVTSKEAVYNCPDCGEWHYDINWEPVDCLPLSHGAYAHAKAPIVMLQPKSAFTASEEGTAWLSRVIGKPAS